MESHKHAADGTSDPSPGLCTLPLTPLVSQASPAWVPHPCLLHQREVVGSREKAKNQCSLGTWMTDTEVYWNTAFLLRHFLLYRRRKYQKSHKSAPLGNFFYTQYSYISYFSPDLWVLIETVQPPGPLGVHLSLTSVDLQNTQILFTEQALLSQFSSDAAPFPN